MWKQEQGKEGSDTSYQIRRNEEAERQVLQVRTERTLETELPKGHQKASGSNIARLLKKDKDT